MASPSQWEKTDSNRLMEEWRTDAKSGTHTVRMTKAGGVWTVNVITSKQKKRPGTHMTTIGQDSNKNEARKVAVEFMREYKNPEVLDAMRFRD
jgi:hypothetical protein